MITFGRRMLLRGIAGAAATGLAGSGRSAAYDGTILFAYFAGGKDETPGLRLAKSRDGLAFTPVRRGDILLVPEVGETKLMRDPFLMRGHGGDARWHLLWTTAWEGVTLGHATSHDLVHWSPQRAIPVMAAIKGTRNVWAPEMIWDPVAGRYVIFWSSTVEGLFAETAGRSEDGYNHRLWCCTTQDFETFSETKLLWDPGFSVIDATYLQHPRLGLHIIVKDETLKPPRKHLRIARATSPIGPFSGLSKPFSPDWVEGPTALVIGEWTYVYFDRYTQGTWGAARSRDLVHWEDVSSRISLPPGARHGTVVHAPAALIRAIG